MDKFYYSLLVGLIFVSICAIGDIPSFSSRTRKMDSFSRNQLDFDAVICNLVYIRILDCDEESKS